MDGSNNVLISHVRFFRLVVDADVVFVCVVVFEAAAAADAAAGALLSDLLLQQRRFRAGRPPAAARAQGQAGQAARGQPSGRQHDGNLGYGGGRQPQAEAGHPGRPPRHGRQSRDTGGRGRTLRTQW